MPGEAEGGQGQGGSAATTYTQEQVDALIAEKNKGIEANRNQILEELRAAKEKAKSYEGIDLEEHRQLKAAAEKAERERQEAAGNFKALEEQMNKKHADDRAKMEQEQKRLRTTIDEYLIDSEALRALAPLTESPELLLPHVRAQMRVFEEDGRFVARIIDAKGNVRIGSGQGSEKMTLPELLEEMKQDKRYALAFKGTGSSGGGASRSNASGGGTGKATGSILDSLEDIASGKRKFEMAR